jgi:hypothetical protein
MKSEQTMELSIIDKLSIRSACNFGDKISPKFGNKMTSYGAHGRHWVAKCKADNC